MPAEVEDTKIVDVALFQDADVDDKLRRCACSVFSRNMTARCLTCGTAWSGDDGSSTLPSVIEARTMGMALRVRTNNAMHYGRPNKAQQHGLQATPRWS